MLQRFELFLGGTHLLNSFFLRSMLIYEASEPGSHLGRLFAVQVRFGDFGLMALECLHDILRHVLDDQISIRPGICRHARADAFGLHPGIHAVGNLIANRDLALGGLALRAELFEVPVLLLQPALGAYATGGNGGVNVEIILVPELAGILVDGPFQGQVIFLGDPAQHLLRKFRVQLLGDLIGNGDFQGSSIDRIDPGLCLLDLVPEQIGILVFRVSTIGDDDAGILELVGFVREIELFVRSASDISRPSAGATAVRFSADAN